MREHRPIRLTRRGFLAGAAPAADAMADLADLFPFPGTNEINQPDRVAKGVVLLAAVRDAETRAAESIRQAAESDWPDE